MAGKSSLILGNRFLTVATLIGAARVSKRYAGYHIGLAFETKRSTA
jgi:hypothetical protein